MLIPEQICLRPPTNHKLYNWETSLFGRNEQKYAITFKDPEGYVSIIAVFSGRYWAETFMAMEGIGDSYSLMEVVE